MAYKEKINHLNMGEYANRTLGRLTQHTKNPQKGSRHLENFSNCFWFALLSETGPAVLPLPTRTPSKDIGTRGIFIGFGAHFDSHNNPVVFFVHVRAYGYGNKVQNVSSYLCEGVEQERWNIFYYSICTIVSSFVVYSNSAFSIS